MVKTAVILAAGLGSRMGDKTKNRPKGFLEIGDKPIIEHSVCKLIEAGMEKILIGTGYLHEVYDEFALKYPQIKCVFIKEFQSTGSMNTLFHLKDEIDGDFLLLESDLIYDKMALSTLLREQRQDVILACGLTFSGDEVYIETNPQHFLVNMSKRKEDLTQVCAELVGISKISYPTYLKMCDYAVQVFPSQPGIDYEYVLVGISKEQGIHVHKLPGLAWCEIDDETHWNRATQQVYPLIQAREMLSKPIKRNILLNPGPATTTDTVKIAQIVPDICPREKEFGLLMENVATELTQFVADTKEYTTVLFGGSGTAAVESIISSVSGGDETILVIQNGAYGRRMCQIAEAYGINYIEYPSAFDDAVDLQKLEAFIQKYSKTISYLAIVHNETTTGLLNNIESMGKLCNKYKISMIVDAMSSFAAIPIDMKRMNICYLAASANKNLQGLPGVSFVIAHKGQLENTQHIKPRNFYLHLFSQYNYFNQTKQMRFTPPVQTLYALQQAIIETKQEGIVQRYERYAKSWNTLIQGISQLGLHHLVKEQHHSKLITSIIEPESAHYHFDEMHDFFYRQGFTIYPGKLEGLNTFRVANMGAITYKDIEEFLQLLKQYLTGTLSQEGDS